MDVPKTKLMSLNKLKTNPDNPRLIKDDNYKKLVQSIKDFPEMREAREIIVNKDLVILGGNMRFRAMQEAGVTEAPVKIVDWSEEKQREFIIKDNHGSGEWDWEKLANAWDVPEIASYGLDVVGKIEFNPNTNPDFNTGDVNSEEIETKAKELAKQMLKEQMTKEMTCPKCGHTFFIEYEK